MWRGSPIRRRRIDFCVLSQFAKVSLILLRASGVFAIEDSTRPCGDGDLRFAVGACSDLGVRRIVAYIDQAADTRLVCNVSHKASIVVPKPLERLSCEFACPAGHRLGFVAVSKNALHRTIESVCKVCPAGQYSLGGGFLISGVAGDWAKPWLTGWHTLCFFQESQSRWEAPQWQHGNSGHSGCRLRVDSPASVKGEYVMAAHSLNSGLGIATPFQGRVVRAPGDRKACSSLKPWKDPDEASGRLVLLAETGGCSAEEKANHAKDIGAIALLLSFREGGVLRIHSNATGPALKIPVFAVNADDGEVIAIASVRGLYITIPDVGCAAAPRELEHCEPWAADPVGQFVHSGNNSRFRSVMSTLKFSGNFVRDGSVLFRYAADSEPIYDGLTFYVDMEQKMGLVSRQLDYTTMLVNVTKGLHTLEWVYSKDADGSVGEDRAWIQLVEVVGVSYADLQCVDCHSQHTHSRSGSSFCNACGTNEFLERDAQDYAKCVSCPPGRWSHAGSVGNFSCFEKFPCTDHDVESVFTLCIGNERTVQQRWRLPTACDTDHAESVKLSQLFKQNEAAPCEPCQPNTRRPAEGGECKPQSVECAAGEQAVPEFIVNRWPSWPANFTQELRQMGGSPPVDEHAWHLEPNGAYAFSGVEAIASERADGTAATAAHDGLGARASMEIGDAILTLPVTVQENAVVRFVCEVWPLEAWLRRAIFWVDNVAPGMIHAEAVHGASPNTLLVTVPLVEGRRRLSWVWQYRPGVKQTNDQELRRGFVLVNVTVEQAVGAGSSRCTGCPSGQEAVRDRCVKCPAGKTSNANTSVLGKPGERSRCAACPKGFYSAQEGSAQCHPCAVGMESDAGAKLCSLSRSVTFSDSTNGSAVVFNASGVVDAWNRAYSSRNPIEITGNRFLVNLLEPVHVNGAPVGEFGHFWQLPTSTECQLSGEAPGEPLNLGSQMSAVEAVVVSATMRGLRFRYTSESEFCPSDPGRLRSSSLFIQCRTADEELSMNDSARSLIRLSSTSVGSANGCPDDVELSWSTPAACPLCRNSDFLKEFQPCGADSQREFTIIKVGACLGGIVQPLSGQENCERWNSDEVNGILRILVFGALLLGVALMAYAIYLHQKYYKRYMAMK